MTEEYWEPTDQYEEWPEAYNHKYRKRRYKISPSFITTKMGNTVVLSGTLKYIIKEQKRYPRRKIKSFWRRRGLWHLTMEIVGEC